MIGIERDGELKYQFNGMVEKEQAFGLELYETPFRSYDAQLGRFWQVEPLADIYVGVSMYQFGYNNPISFNDPSGLSSDDPNMPVEKKEEKEEGNLPRYIDLGTPSGLGDIFGNGGGRSSPYSMGGTPGEGPASITIVNFGRDPDLAASIPIIKNTFKRMGLNVKVNYVTSTYGMGREDASGINAVLLSFW